MLRKERGEWHYPSTLSHLTHTNVLQDQILRNNQSDTYD